MMNRTRITLTAVFLFLASFSSQASAEKLSYDPYADEPRTAAAYDETAATKSDRLYSILNLPSLPFRAGAAGTEKVLNWADSTHFPQKVRWFWQDILQENGLFPETRFSHDSPFTGPGGHVEFEKLLKTEQRLPWLKVHAGGGMTTDLDADVWSSYELAQEEGLQFYQKGLFSFNHLADETFWGLGPRSSLGDGVDYQMNTTRLEAKAGLHPWRVFDVGGKFSYRHVTVGNTRRNDKADIENYYPIGDLPGVDGGKIVSVGPYIAHDTRDFADDPSKGGLRSFSADFNRDTAHGDNYMKYRLELAQYFPLWSERRTLVTNFFAEHVQDMHHSSIPFFDMARVGGYGIQPIGSATLRGYKYNRYFDKSSAVLNLEYRYNVWQYGNFGADWELFCDMGKVYGDLHEFGIGGLKVGYGTGVRFKAHRRVFLTFEVAHGSEGTAFYVKTKTPF